MRIDDYQRQAATTAIYQDKLVYPALGLAGEVGELLHKMADGSIPEAAAKEIGDVLWYVAAVATDSNLSLFLCIKQFKPGGPGGFASVPTMDTTFPNENLAEQAGIVCECAKKTLRDNSGVLSDARLNKIADALSDILCLLSEFALECNTTLDVVAQDNLDKLASRAARGTLTGDGDNR